jgi:gluconate 2-dehydrogenase gamma chain
VGESVAAEGRPAGMSRRAAIKLGVVGLVGAAVGAGATSMAARLGRAPKPRWRRLTDAEASLLADICEELIPRDDAPGAADVGAVEYIDLQLCGPFARHRQAYRRGLDSFARTCEEVFRGPFGGLAPADRIRALRLVEQGAAPGALWGDPSQQAFFNLVLAHTMQGFYGSPRHGGNRDYASYRMLGLDYPQLVGQDRRGKARA